MTNPAPSWYPDPTDSSQLRWWDGSAWTNNTQPAPTTTPDPNATTQISLDSGWAAPAGEQPAQTNQYGSYDQPGETDQYGHGPTPHAGPPNDPAPPAPMQAMPYAEAPYAAGPHGVGVGAPPPEKKGGKIGLIIGAIVAVAILGIGGFLLTRGGGDDTAADETTTTTEADDPEDTTTSEPDTTTTETTEGDSPDDTTTVPEETTTTAAATPGVPEGWSPFSTEVYSLALPPRYMIMDPGLALSEVEAMEFEDLNMQEVQDLVLESGLDLLAFDTKGVSTGGAANLNILTVEVPVVMGLDLIDQSTRQQAEMQGLDPASVTSDRIMVDGEEAIRFHYPAELWGAVQTQYMVPTGNYLVTLTFTWADLEPELDMTDEIMGTFVRLK